MLTSSRRLSAKSIGSALKTPRSRMPATISCSLPNAEVTRFVHLRQLYSFYNKPPLVNFTELRRSGVQVDLQRRRQGHPKCGSLTPSPSLPQLIYHIGSMKDRLPTLYVLPRGTRESIDKLKQRFEDTSEAKRAAAYVTKDHEPGDIGINGVSKLAGDRIPLDVFRSQVIRTVVKKTSAKAGGKASYVTIKKGKKSKTAEEDDQKALARFK
ncbi:hypothetical protein BV25DRAFT_1525215 [Artomyces pyxidatus]|uniref:Uncharacterized protein n=1 Tax=Artomyces pyxidatus TaxID=48021 RepID=A0ACB8TD89_9AGAM|nr:hypothetical protein BV25DRAFT_1525215 [Artomyces pyxidatus]